MSIALWEGRRKEAPLKSACRPKTKRAASSLFFVSGVSPWRSAFSNKEASTVDHSPPPPNGWFGAGALNRWLVEWFPICPLQEPVVETIKPPIQTKPDLLRNFGGLVCKEVSHLCVS